MSSAHYSTWWVLVGTYGLTMTMDDVQRTFFPDITLKTMANKAAKGELPLKTGDVFDTRHVAEWWDNQLNTAHAGRSAKVVAGRRLAVLKQENEAGVPLLHQ